eukprot:2691279-Prymnesium_polylepis.1
MSALPQTISRYSSSSLLLSELVSRMVSSAMSASMRPITAHGSTFHALGVSYQRGGPRPRRRRVVVESKGTVTLTSASRPREVLTVAC